MLTISISVTLTACRHCPPSNDTLPAHLQLIALDLDYVWQTNSKATSGRLDTAINPFARHLSLPYLTATDNTVGRFVSFHLVRRASFYSLSGVGMFNPIGRRYPLIFGPWCKQLDVESNFFPSILISIQSIMERSRNPVFRDTCQDLFKVRPNMPLSIFFEHYSVGLQAQDNVYLSFCCWGIVKIPWRRGGSVFSSRNLHI